jgi:hypothetical protein
MMNMDEIRERLAEQDRHHETTDAQRAANQHRLMLYELLTRSRAPYEGLRPSLDVIMERLTNGTTYTPNSLLKP